MAFSRLQNIESNGDFSSGISRLRALQGHPNIVQLIAVCPEWDRFVSHHSDAFAATHQKVVEEGYADLFNSIVTPFHDNGDLENIEIILQSGHYPNNWQQRMKIAIDYARVMAFLHNTGPELNPFGQPLVQKDRKISQFLLGKDLALHLNDVEAMPITNDAKDLKEDLAFMPVILRKIFGNASLPAKVAKVLEEIYRDCESENLLSPPLTAADILHKLLLLVEF